MFVVHGPVRSESPVYVERPEVLDTMAGWLERAGCVGVVLGARQTGKTSACFRLRDAFGTRSRFAYVDFQGFQGSSWDECAAYIAGSLASQLGAGAGGQGTLRVPDTGARLPGFLAALAQLVTTARITVVFEELGCLAEDSRQRLGQMVRAMFNGRLYEPAYQRYVFMILGAHELRDVAGTRNSPLWNVADKLYLGDFDREQVATLLRAATSLSGEPAQRMGDFLYDWTSGHPYWTQRLAKELVERVLPVDPVFADLDAAHLAVELLLQHEDTNLPHLIELLDSEGDGLWTVLDRALDGALAFTRFNRKVAVLELCGAIVNRGGRCRIRNRIYRHVIAQRLGRAAAEAPATSRSAPNPVRGGIMPDPATPAVFISYTHDSKEHRQRVLELAQRLRADGADCMLDRFVNGSPPEGWPLWMERQIQRADFVLVVCTATYLRRYRGEEQPGKGLGGTWEAVLTRQELYESSARNTKFVPILFPGASRDDIPKPLRPYTSHCLPDGYVELLRYLTGQPAIVPRPLGQKKLLPPER